jgi:hypothetical protein
MKGKGREGIGTGGLWEKGKGARGFWPNGLLLPPSRIRTERGKEEVAGAAGLGGGGVGGPAHGGGREVAQNGEEAEGNRFLSLPRAGVLRRGGSTAAGGDRFWWSVVAVLGGSGGREAWLGWCVARWGAGLALL